jgi:hypothetical protein
VRQRPSEERLSPGTRPRSVGDVLRAPSLGLGRSAGDAVFAGSALRIMGARAPAARAGGMMGRAQASGRSGAPAGPACAEDRVVVDADDAPDPDPLGARQFGS